MNPPPGTGERTRPGPRAGLLARLGLKLEAVGYHVYGHRSAHAQTDVFVISYPKCGRTWLRTILGQYLALLFDQPFTTELDRVRHPGVPSIAFSHRLRDVRYHRGKRIIYLVRDPRDVVVSYYHQLHDRQRRYRGSLSSFIRSRHGIDRVVRYMNRMVTLEQLPSKVLWISYEELSRDPVAELERILNFTGLPNSERHLARAIEFAALGNMQRMEREGAFETERLRPGDPSQPESFKVRKGVVGGYMDELSASDVTFMERRIAATLRPDGYRWRREGSDSSTQEAQP